MEHNMITVLKFLVGALLGSLAWLVTGYTIEYFRPFKQVDTRASATIATVGTLPREIITPPDKQISKGRKLFVGNKGFHHHITSIRQPQR